MSELPRRVLVGSPVHQKPAVLERFLDGLAGQETAGLIVDYVFVDDNADERSSELLREFADFAGTATIVRIEQRAQAYLCDDVTHHWQEALIWRVAEFKDAIIGHAREEQYDSLFLADSDLVLHPRTLTHLAGLDVDIVSEVFWTRWTPQQPELPQVWLRDSYDLVPCRRGEVLTDTERQRRAVEFVSGLRQPGLYEVGGLGACTMISQRALAAGVSFSEIPNLSFAGEDRHFCIRAAAIGFTLHADTTLPPLHLYRESDLRRFDDFAASAGLVVPSWRCGEASVA